MDVTSTDREVIIKDIDDVLSIAITRFLRAAAVPFGHAIKLGILLVALGGCVLVQCTIVAWLCLVAFQAKLILTTATILRAALESPEDATVNVSYDPERAEDAGLLWRIAEREIEVQAAVAEAQAVEEQKRLQAAREERSRQLARQDAPGPQLTSTRTPPSKDEKNAPMQTSWLEYLESEHERSPRRTTENRMPLPSAWKITPEALQEARSFANEATKGRKARRHVQPQQQQHQKKPSADTYAKPLLARRTPTRAPARPAQTPQTARNGVPPHLRKAQEVQEKKVKDRDIEIEIAQEDVEPPRDPLDSESEDAGEEEKEDIDPLRLREPVIHWSSRQLKALNPAAKRPAAPAIPPGFQPMAASPYQQEAFDALLAPAVVEFEEEKRMTLSKAVVRPAASTASVNGGVEEEKSLEEEKNTVIVPTADMPPADSAIVQNGEVKRTTPSVTAVKLPVSAAEIEKRRRAVLKAQELYQDARSYFQLEKGRSMSKNGGRVGDQRLERAAVYYREKCKHLQEVAGSDKALNEVQGPDDLIQLEW